MELEDLRTIWRRIEYPAVGGEAGSGKAGASTGVKAAEEARDVERDRAVEGIRALLGRRSQGLVAKMKRNLFSELILVLGIYTPAILFYFFELGGRLSTVGWALLLLTVFFAGYTYFKNKLLNEMQCLSCTIRSNLQRQAATLQKYVRSYTIAGTILVPVMAIFSFLVSSRNLSGGSPVSAGYSLTGVWGGKDLWIGALALGVITVVSYFTNVWMMNKLYGKPIKKLRRLLEETDAEG